MPFYSGRKSLSVLSKVICYIPVSCGVCCYLYIKTSNVWSLGIWGDFRPGSKTFPFNWFMDGQDGCRILCPRGTKQFNITLTRPSIVQTPTQIEIGIKLFRMTGFKGTCRKVRFWNTFQAKFEQSSPPPPPPIFANFRPKNSQLKWPSSASCGKTAFASKQYCGDCLTNIFRRVAYM